MIDRLSLEGLLLAVHMTDREADHWIFISCDRGPDGELQPINSSGLYPDEASAMLAAGCYVRDWREHLDEDTDPAPITFTIPLFVESETPHG